MFHFHRAARSAVRILSLALVLSTLLYTSTHRLLIRSTGNLHWSSVLDYGHLPTPSAAIAPVEVEKSAKAKLLRETTEFWNELEEAPWEAAPRINAVAPSQQHIEQNFDEKWPDLVHEELITSSPRDKKQLRESHAEMVKAIPALARRLPYKKRTRGVVMTAGEKYINVLMVSLRMLRRVGSELPVEVYFDKRTVATTGVCLAQMAELNAECRFFSEVWQEVHMTELKSFQLKVFALLFSTFEDVLFLDADALAVKNPDQLLSAEPFSNTGLVTWPDFWSSSTSPSFWDVAGVDEGVGKKEDSARASTESGVLLLSKWKHAGTLLLATYYNYYGPGYFYPLLSQSAQGEGDKVTFLHAAIVMNTTFYSVRAAVRVIGNHFGGKWESAGMKQVDPREDFQKNAQVVVNATASPMFVHHNTIKLDPEKVFEHRLLQLKDYDGSRRLWGTTQETIETFGADIERHVWKEVKAVGCALSPQICQQIEQRFKEVYTD